jgi:hypothetical protein
LYNRNFYGALFLEHADSPTGLTDEPNPAFPNSLPANNIQSDERMAGIELSKQDQSLTVFTKAEIENLVKNLYLVWP